MKKKKNDRREEDEKLLQLLAAVNFLSRIKNFIFFFFYGCMWQVYLSTRTV